MNMRMLEVKRLSKNFGGLKAVNLLDFHIEKGEILGLVGPNGAGKTTVFHLITGIHTPSDGEILFRTENVAGLKPHQVARKGISRTFQLTTLYSNCTALENVIMGHHRQLKTGLWEILLRTPTYWKEEAETEKRALEVLEFMGLGEQRETLAQNLPHGYQQRLEIAIAISSKPELLLLDEPVSGMNPEETREMMGLVSRIRDKGTTILMIEHDMKAVMGLCDRIVVLNYGEKLAEGTPDEIKENKEVIEAYLGREDDVA